MYIFGQALGILATICCFVGPIWKKRYQMQLTSMVANVLVGVNTLILNGVCTAMIMNMVAIVQICFALYHLKKETSVSVTENIVFLIAYIFCGALGFEEYIDILPVFGAVLFMICVFQKDAQKARVIGIANAVTYLAYYAILGSTSAFPQVVAIGMNSIAIYKYRKK